MKDSVHYRKKTSLSRIVTLSLPPITKEPTLNKLKEARVINDEAGRDNHD